MTKEQAELLIKTLGLILAQMERQAEALENIECTLRVQKNER
jgi:hypothetical protein